MPLYEYTCEQDGTVIELIRPMARADDPVEDPEGRGRRFVRKHSTFAAGGAGGGASTRAGNLLARNSGGCCPCGKNKGACGG